MTPKIGRPRMLTNEQDLIIAVKYRSHVSSATLAQEFGVSRETIFASLRRTGEPIRARQGSIKAENKGNKRKCIDCLKWKPLTSYYKAKDRGKYYSMNFCNTCHSVRYKHLRKTPAEERANQLKVRYKLSQKDYDRKVLKQKNKCAICRKSSLVYQLAVDHDHACCLGPKSCGECVRDLLCGSCNNLLGCAKDDIVTLKRAIRYLERHNAKKR